MFGRKKPEVLVVGAGPVGLFTALTLAQRGVQVQIVDEAWRPAAHSYALALHSHSLRLLDEAGLLEKALAKAYRVHTVGLYDAAQRRASLRLSELDEAQKFLAVMRQDVLENLLEEALEQRGVRVQWNHQVSRLQPEADHVVATVDKLEKESVGYSVAHMEWVIARSKNLEVPFVVGADGHQSEVRRALEIDFPEVGETKHFAVFEFKTDANLEYEMRLVMEDDTTDVLWPLPDGRCRWSFQLLDFSVPTYSRTKDRVEIQLGGARFPVLTEEHLHTLIDERAPWFKGRIEEIDWRLVVRFERRLADAFGQGRMWLVGDAGHMTGPVGIQSMNVGLREARDLAEILAGLLHGGASMDQLAAYDAARKAEWRYLLGLEGSLEAGADTDPWLRPYAGRLLSCLPASGDGLARLAHQLGLEATGYQQPAVG